MICAFCNRDCKQSDSRPHLSSKLGERIHNRCFLRKSISDKKRSSLPKDKNCYEAKGPKQLKSALEGSGLFEKLQKDNIGLEIESNKRFLEKHTETRKEETSSFFDLKSGIAKPHEKRRFLNHRNLTEIVGAYDDEGFQEKSDLRTYHQISHSSSGDSDMKLPRRTPVAGGDHKAKVKYPRRQPVMNPDCLKKISKIKIDENNPCWFCLSSPKVEKHLILTIGQHCYLTIAKGGLNDEHLLIIPIEHIPSTSSIELGSEIITELEKFKTSLIEYFRDNGKGVIFFERNFRSVHWHLQVVPVDIQLIDGMDEKIKTLSMRHFKNSDYVHIPDKCSIRDVVPPESPYISWQIEPVGVRFASEIQVKGSYFPVQLGRMILADESILNCSDRVDWKLCCMSDQEYSELVKVTMLKYKDYDIT